MRRAKLKGDRILKKRKDGDGAWNVAPNGNVTFTKSYGYDAFGKRIRKKFTGKTEAECRRKCKEFEKGVIKQEKVTVNQTLKTWLPLWLKTYKEDSVQSSTYKEYEYLADKILNHSISNMLLTDIKSIQVTQFFKDNKKYSSTILKKMRFLLTAAFESAIDTDLCYKNPVKRAVLPKKDKPTKESFTPEEERIMLDFATQEEEFGIFIKLLLLTGIRGGELRALSPSSFVFKDNYILINKAIKRNETLGTTKNGEPRIIPISNILAEELKEKINLDSKYALGEGEKWVTASGFRSRYQTFFRKLNVYCLENELPTINIQPPHVCRHTFSTSLQRKGIPVAIVSSLMGHKSTDVTDGYTHLNRLEDLRRAIQK